MSEPKRERDARLRTSLGPPLVRRGRVWVLDLEELPIVHGLSVLSRALAEAVAAQVNSDRIDVDVERRLRARENPELHDLFGVDLVKVTAERAAVADIAQRPQVIEHHLRALLGSLQREHYRSQLLPTHRGPSRALLADFSRAIASTTNRRFLLEFVRSPRGNGRGFLRITIEDPRGRRLDLASIPHVVLEGVEDRSFIAGSTRISHTWADLVRRESERGRRSLTEKRRAHGHLFEQLAQVGLGEVERVTLTWTEDLVPWLLEGDRDSVHRLLKRVLLSIEDRHVRELLVARKLVRIDGEGTSAYLDLSHLGRTLNLSLGEQRHREDVESFLARMPSLQAALERLPAKALAGTRVFLVHHMTAEVLGLIAALRRLGCRRLTVLFVVYSGEPPASYLDALLELPQEEFRALGLTNVPRADSVEGTYRLSGQYSPVPDRALFERALRGNDETYLTAMRAVAVAAFAGERDQARAAGERLLVIEDGGYLAPTLNDAARSGLTTADFLGSYGLVAGRGDERLWDWLADTWIGSVEHTRNGHDRLAEVLSRHGGLAFPAFSIAVSRLKLEVESKEVAVSVLNAVESVLHAEGRILSRRRVLVLGSRGTIGRALFSALEHRLCDPAAGLRGLDLRVERPGREARTLAELAPEDWTGCDLVLGVTGDSVLQAADLERWWLAGEGRELTLASGSTKTVEFTDVVRWMNGLLEGEPARVGDVPVQVEVEALEDPRTGRLHGHRYRIRPVHADGPETGEPAGPGNAIVFLANLTPVNFLFYGVPTELIDEVLTQLFTVAIGLCRRVDEGTPPAAILHAVDREIDGDGRPL